MSRSEKIINETLVVIEPTSDLNFADDMEEAVVEYIDDRGGICVLDNGNWCFSDELDDDLEEAMVRKVRHGKNVVVHTLTGSRKTAAVSAGRRNIKSNRAVMTRKAHTVAAEKLRRKTMEKKGLWKRGGSTASPKPTTPSKSPMASRMKSRI
jgi:hypothetical protein